MLTNNSSAAEVEVQEAAPAVTPKKSAKKAVLDLTALRENRSQARSEETGKFTQSQYPVRKPGARNFFRVHPSADYHIYGVSTMEDDEKGVHIVQAGYEPPENVQRFIQCVNLLTCVVHKGGFFLWPYKESTNQWSLSAASIAKKAINEWVRIRPNMGLSCYESESAPPELAEVTPTWPTLSFAEIMNIAFDGRVIDSDSSPIIQGLQGRV